MKLLIMQSSPASCHFLPSGPNILLSTLFSNTLNLCSSPSTKHQVSQPHKVAGKIVILHILMFKFLERRREDKDSEENGIKHSPNLMCS
jgi:hypothetical protein